MNVLLRKSLEILQKTYRRLRERTGQVSGFADMEMHLWMLTDEARVAAFETAIAEAVRPGDVVLDLGAGTGLLSLMACRAGAARVYAIEERSVIDLARTLARDNGMDGRIVFLRGNSARIDLPERVDLIVSETIGAFVFSENITSILDDARRRFLKPGGAMIPDRIVIQIAPVESYAEGVGFWEKPVHGFDLSSAAPCFDVSIMASGRKIAREDLLDRPQLLYDLDFMKEGPAPADYRRDVAFVARRGGSLHGFLATWEARSRGRVFLACEAGSFPINWPPSLFRLAKGIPVRPGDRIGLLFDRKDVPGWAWRWEAAVSST